MGKYEIDRWCVKIGVLWRARLARNSCKETINSEGVAQLYVKHVVSHFGTPRKVISDQDTQFTSNLTTELCKTLGIKQNTSSMYHPQTDGQRKCINQSLEQYLRIVYANNQNT